MLSVLINIVDLLCESEQHVCQQKIVLFSIPLISLSTSLLYSYLNSNKKQIMILPNLTCNNDPMFCLRILKFRSKIGNKFQFEYPGTREYLQNKHRVLKYFKIEYFGITSFKQAFRGPHAAHQLGLCVPQRCLK